MVAIINRISSRKLCASHLGLVFDINMRAVPSAEHFQERLALYDTDSSSSSGTVGADLKVKFLYLMYMACKLRRLTGLESQD